MSATSDANQPPLTEERVREIFREELYRVLLNRPPEHLSKFDDTAWRISETICRRMIDTQLTDRQIPPLPIPTPTFKVR